MPRETRAHTVPYPQSVLDVVKNPTRVRLFHPTTLDNCSLWILHGATKCPCNFFADSCVIHPNCVPPVAPLKMEVLYIWQFGARFLEKLSLPCLKLCFARLCFSAWKTDTSPVRAHEQQFIGIHAFQNDEHAAFRHFCIADIIVWDNSRRSWSRGTPQASVFSSEVVPGSLLQPSRSCPPASSFPSGS